MKFTFQARVGRQKGVCETGRINSVHLRPYIGKKVSVTIREISDESLLIGETKIRYSKEVKP